MTIRRRSVEQRLAARPLRVPVATDGSGFTGASWDQETAAAAEPAHLQAVLEHEFASNTLRTYRIQWQGFCGWAAEHREPAIPARPSAVAAYLAERLERHGRKPATLRVVASAIAFVHRVRASHRRSR